jgi:hypothetical protein
MGVLYVLLKKSNTDMPESSLDSVGYAGTVPKTLTYLTVLLTQNLGSISELWASCWMG